MCVCVCACAAHCLCVGIVSPEMQGHGTDDPQLRGHLLHPPEPPLLLRIGEFHHQAWRGALRWKTVSTPLNQTFFNISRNMQPRKISVFRKLKADGYCFIKQHWSKAKIRDAGLKLVLLHIHLKVPYHAKFTFFFLTITHAYSPSINSPEKRKVHPSLLLTPLLD